MYNKAGRPSDREKSGRFTRVEYGIMFCTALMFLEKLAFQF